MKKILFVCLGNICRSPIAEGIARARFAQEGLDIEVASAGLGDWHVGSPPDRRAISAAWHAGVDISGQRAAQVNLENLPEFTLVLGMDRKNVAALEGLAGGESTQIRLLMEFTGKAEVDIPDPYYGGHQGFDEVVLMVEEAVKGLITHLS
ncbi:MAG: low molecular weight protein-tyrosine-phosphatase [Alphaproteobacteria bacterium]